VSTPSARLIDSERQEGEPLPDVRVLAVELAGLLGRETTPPLLDFGTGCGDSERAEVVDRGGGARRAPSRWNDSIGHERCST
jgi:hypothetical protein